MTGSPVCPAETWWAAGSDSVGSWGARLALVPQEQTEDDNGKTDQRKQGVKEEEEEEEEPP